MKNELAGDLSLAESKNQYDDKVKRVLSNKIILAWILKYVTEEFAIPMESKTMGEELNQMCNLSDYVEELGIEQGRDRRDHLGIGKETAVADAGLILICLKGISGDNNKVLAI